MLCRINGQKFIRAMKSYLKYFLIYWIDKDSKKARQLLSGTMPGGKKINIFNSQVLCKYYLSGKEDL